MIASGTYRLGGTVGVPGVTVSQQFAPGAPAIGWNAPQRLCWLDLYPGEGGEAAQRVARATGVRPEPINGPIALIASVDDSNSGAFCQDTTRAGLSLVVAAVDAIDLDVAIQGTPAPSFWATPLGSPEFLKLGTAINAAARWLWNIWPDVAGDGCAVDLRELAQGRRFLAVWVRGWWVDVAYQTPATAAGWPVAWAIRPRQVARPRGYAWALPLDQVAGAGNPFPADVAWRTLGLGAPSTYRVASPMMPGQGATYIALHDYSTAGQTVGVLVASAYAGVDTTPSVLKVLAGTPAVQTSMSGPTLAIYAGALGGLGVSTATATVLGMYRAGV